MWAARTSRVVSNVAFLRQKSAVGNVSTSLLQTFGKSKNTFGYQATRAMTMTIYDPARIRNVAIIAHVDHGKCVFVNFFFFFVFLFK